MTPEEKELLQKTYELSEENNKILHSLRRSNRVRSFFRIVYWVLIICVSVGAFYYIQPYVNVVIKAYQGIQNDINTFKTTTGSIMDRFK